MSMRTGIKVKGRLVWAWCCLSVLLADEKTAVVSSGGGCLPHDPQLPHPVPPYALNIDRGVQFLSKLVDVAFLSNGRVFPSAP